MKKLIVVLFVFLLTSAIAFAEGGQNQGDTGTGTTSTGDAAQGSASQDRAGR